MRSLFLKIFLSFWLASALIVGALVIPAMWVPLPSRVEARARAMAETVLTRYGREAVDVLERDGRSAADEYVERLERAIDMHVFLFDESSHNPPASGFRAFAKAGKQPAKLHIEYESLEEWPLEWIETHDEPLSYVVEKMRPARTRSRSGSTTRSPWRASRRRSSTTASATAAPSSGSSISTA